MDLSTTEPPVSTKPYTIPLKYKSFIDEEIRLLEDAGCISKSLSDWAFDYMHCEEEARSKSTPQVLNSTCVLTTERSINL